MALKIEGVNVFENPTRNARTARKHELEAIKARERESATRLETERRVVRLCPSTGAKFNELEDN